jgi:plasmid rolling circle replication initiator protein Rep
MSTAWLNLIRYKRVKTILRGFFKALEITYNKAVDTYHPHIHAVLAVPKNYFISRDYIKRDEWLSLWRKSMKNPRITQVDIRKAKDKRDLKLGDTAVNTLSSAVAEIAKYAVKSSSYLFFDEKLLKNGVYLPNEELTDKVVSVLVPALAGRRLCSFGGCFLKAHQALQLDDAEDGDLIHIDGDLRSDIAVQIYRYGWSCGTYKLIEIRDNEK